MLWEFSFSPPVRGRGDSLRLAVLWRCAHCVWLCSDSLWLLFVSQDGRVPCRINHGSVRHTLQWDRPSSELDFTFLLPCMADGIGEWRGGDHAGLCSRAAASVIALRDLFALTHPLFLCFAVSPPAPCLRCRCSLVRCFVPSPLAPPLVARSLLFALPSPLLPPPSFLLPPLSSQSRPSIPTR